MLIGAYIINQIYTLRHEYFSLPINPIPKERTHRCVVEPTSELDNKMNAYIPNLLLPDILIGGSKLIVKRSFQIVVAICRDIQIVCTS